MSFITVKNLKVTFSGEETQTEVLHGISFSVEKGEILGIVGASGSGKSMTSLALMHLLPVGSVLEAEEMTLNGENLLEFSEKDWQSLRGKKMAMVFQEPMTSLNPVLTIQTQLEEVLLLHDRKTYRKQKAKRRERVIEALKEAGLLHPEELLRCYPHQLSGGMRQRVMIAMAMLSRPDLLIADEPTTALDEETQEVILRLFEYYRKTYGTSILFISHDLKLVERLCDRVVAMEDGRMTEKLPRAERFRKTSGEYGEEILKVSRLQISFKEASFWGKDTKKEVIADVSFSLHRGETLGLVGASGSGKSTITKAVAGLIPAEAGCVERKEGIRRPQMVFQDPYGSLNPAKTIGWILEEPLKIHGKIEKKERKRLVIEALKGVELNEDHAKRYVRELSGGQRQRAAIALALINRPDIVVLDEPVSALDVMIQEQILQLLDRLKKEHGMSYLFISHDKDVVSRFCDRVLVLKDGTVREL